MIIEVNEIVYKGILCQHVENRGWKIALAEYEYLFPTLQDAQAAIREFHNEVVKKYRGAPYRERRQ